MLQKKRNLQLGSLSILLLGVLGCGQLVQSGVDVPVTKISDIQKNRNAYSEVYLKGKVVTIAPFLGSGAYELQDDTGSLWVITKQALPTKEDKLLIKSQVQYQSILVGGKDLGEVYVQEQAQMERKQGQNK